MKVSLHFSKNLHSSKISYVLGFLNNHPLNNFYVTFIENSPTADFKISYGCQSKKSDFTIPCQKLLFSEEKVNTVELVSNTYVSGGEDLHSVENHQKIKSAFLSDSTFGFDIIETIFFHLSRYEEYFFLKENKLPISENDLFIIKNKLEKKPVVDQLVFRFISVFKQLEIKDTEVTITHDIDHIQKFKNFSCYIRHGIALFKSPNIRVFGRYLKQISNYLFYQKEPYDVWEALLTGKKVSKEIYFLVGGLHKNDTPINLSHPQFKKAISIALKNGYKIGIHPSYNSWIDKDIIKKEKVLLESYTNINIRISRQHYLHIHIPKTLSLLEELKIEKDSSIGFTTKIGFRSGTGFPYPFFCLEKQAKLNIIVEPLVLMDSSLIYEGKENKNKILEIFNDFWVQCRQNTHICVNIHNSRLEESSIKNLGLSNIYNTILND